MQQNEVMAAFEILLEEVEAVIDACNEEGAAAFRKSRYEAAREVMERAAQIMAFRDRVKTLQKDWETLFARKAAETLRKASRGKVRSRRLRKGLRTPEDAYRLPILEVLCERGGSAPIGEVLDAVYERMKAILNPYDFQPVSSNPDQPRWRNSAQWCRNTMVTEGLLATECPRGTWRITQAGRAELVRLKAEPQDSGLTAPAHPQTGS
ncbi:MAG: winged helix-turn-helix domain-containing protein [Acetobacteraceae bacterium]|nr:winged helix-turn-helix domain-containing protein [Acetobacteraceae bacterium]